MTARIAAGLWVAAYMQRLQIEGLPVYVVARGDPTAGAVAVKCATLDGAATLYERRTDWDTGMRVWEAVLTAPEAEVDALVARQRERDPDLWVIEVESRDGRTLLDDPGLAG